MLLLFTHNSTRFMDRLQSVIEEEETRNDDVAADSDWVSALLAH